MCYFCGVKWWQEKNNRGDTYCRKPTSVTLSALQLSQEKSSCVFLWYYGRRGKYSNNYRKTAGTKIKISPFRYMIETSGFIHYTHICSSYISEREVLKSLTVLLICRFNLTPKIGPLDLIQKFLENLLNTHWTSKNQVLYLFYLFKLKKKGLPHR